MTGYVIKADHEDEFLVVIRSEDVQAVQDFIANLRASESSGINKIGNELEASWRRIWDE
jgi:hypothetical protein